MHFRSFLIAICMIWLSAPAMAEWQTQEYEGAPLNRAEKKVWDNRNEQVVDARSLVPLAETTLNTKKVPYYKGPFNVVSANANAGGNNIATATVISILPYSDNGTTTGFTDNYDEACPYASNSPDVVYAYTPATDAVIDINLCGSSYDTKLFVYENSASNLLACGEDACGEDGYKSGLWILELIGGNTYYIVVDGYDGDHGNYLLVVTDSYQIECPPGAIAEGEPTGCDYPDVTNGGCSTSPNRFTPISSGDTICGTTGTFKEGSNLNRDIDSYELVITETSWVSVRIETEAPLVAGFIETVPVGSGDCETATGNIDPLFWTFPGTVIEFQDILEPGTHWLFVSAVVWDGVPCDAGYVVSVLTGPDIVCPPGAIDEDEAIACDYPDVTNGGCMTSDPPAFSPIDCGDTICGTIGSFAVAEHEIWRNWDFYELDLSDPALVTWTVVCNLPIVATIWQGLASYDGIGCDDEVVFDHEGSGGHGDTVRVQANLPAGVSWLSIGTSMLTPTCDGRYVATADCETCPSEDLDCDSVLNESDNCPSTYNRNQEDLDGDGVGDACDELAPNFTGSVRYGVGTVEVTFSDLSLTTNSITDWYWDFGDITSSVESNPVHLYTAPGTYDVMLRITSVDGVDSLIRPAYVIVDDGSGLTFDLKRTYPAWIYDVASADLDQDNNTDVIYSTRDHGIYVMQGNGDGTFGVPAEQYAYSNDAVIELGLIDTDSLPDLVARELTGIAVYLNKSELIFERQPFITLPYKSGFKGVAAGYLNDDPYTDIITALDHILLGDGAGNFPGYRTFPSWFLEIDVADFNSDGYDDVVIGNDSLGAVIFTNDGDANFVAGGVAPILGMAVSATASKALADINHDGNSDFAVASWGALSSSLVTVALGDGTGGFVSWDTTRIDGYIVGLHLADVNRDNNLDLVTINWSYQRLEIYFGDGLGRIGDFEDYLFVDLEPTEKCASFTAGDFNRDGNSDFVVGPRWSGDSIIVLTSNLPPSPVLGDEMVVTGYDNINLEITNPDGFVISQNFRTVAGSEYWRFDAEGDAATDSLLDDRTLDYNLMNGEYTVVCVSRFGDSPNVQKSIGIRINGTAQVYLAYQSVITGPLYRGEPAEDTVVFYYTVEEISSIQPPNGQATGILQPNLDWSRLADTLFPSAVTYDLQVDPDYYFADPVYNLTGLSAPEFPIPAPLTDSTLYYWRVRAHDGGVYSEYSRTFALLATDDSPDCCINIRGNANGDTEENINISDVTYLVDYLFGVPLGPPPPCPNEGNANGDGAGNINISDVTYLVDYLFGVPLGDPPPACP